MLSALNAAKYAARAKSMQRTPIWITPLQAQQYINYIRFYGNLGHTKFRCLHVGVWQKARIEWQHEWQSTGHVAQEVDYHFQWCATVPVDCILLVFSVFFSFFLLLIECVHCLIRSTQANGAARGLWSRDVGLVATGGHRCTTQTSSQHEQGGTLPGTLNLQLLFDFDLQIFYISVVTNSLFLVFVCVVLLVLCCQMHVS